MARTKQTAWKPSGAVRVHPANFSSAIPSCSECGSNVWKCASRCGQRAEHVAALCRGAFGYLDWEEVDETLLQQAAVGVNEGTTVVGDSLGHPSGEVGGNDSATAAEESCEQMEQIERGRRYRTAREQVDLLEETERCIHRYICQKTDCGAERDASYVHSRMDMCESCNGGTAEDDRRKDSRGDTMNRCTNIAVNGVYCRKHRGRRDSQGSCGRKRTLSIGEETEPRENQHHQKEKPRIQ